jgi:predicted amidohydrolase
MSTLTVTLVQTDLHWEDPTLNRQLLGEKIRSFMAKTELVILPETFTTGFSMQPEKLAETMDGATLHWMRQIAAEKKIILAGSLLIKDNDDYFNRLIWMLPNGQYGYYDKRHLFAYGGEGQSISSGKKRLIASVKGWKINLQVCYDLRFPAWSRNGLDENGQPLYDVLVYVANWPAPRIQAWKTLLQARAIENQCYVIGVNRIGRDGKNLDYTGYSMVIDPLGEILHQLGEEECMVTVLLAKERLDAVRKKLPFLEDGDHFDISI